MDQMTVIPIDLVIPEKKVVENELTTDFEKATVEWVDSPDLTRAPFFFSTALGLCGDTALLDIGGTWNLFPLPKTEKIFYFKNILRKLNRIYNENHIIGGGLCIRQSDDCLGEFIMNASFLPAADDEVITFKNQSHFAYQEMNHARKKIILQLISDTDPHCNIYGNFFVSNGLKKEVLQVRAKKRIGRDFIDAMQHAIRRFPYVTNSQLMGFGGTFAIKNGSTIQHVIRNKWTNPIRTRDEIRDCIKYLNVPCAHDISVVGFATFINADIHVANMNPGFEKIFLSQSRAHAYCPWLNYGGGYFHGTERSNRTEYLGYFSPATKLYRIDPVPIFYEMAEFHYL